jgi:nucleoid-associated protein YgaU
MSGLVPEHIDIAPPRGKPSPDSADAHEVTALAASRFGSPFAVAPAKAARDPRRSSAWTEPEPWIVAVLLATGVAVIARHPIAQAIGTETDETTLTPSVVATAPPSTTQAVPAPAAAAAAVPTHAPRNPFHALVSASGAIIAPEAVQAAGAASKAGTHLSANPGTSKPSTPALGSATCAGTMHTVVAGDTLWTLAAKIVKSNDVGRINVVWHRIYKANTPPLGSNPSLLPVGAKLCLPSHA